MLGRQLCAQEEEGNGIVGAAGSHQHQPCGVDLGAHTDGLAPPYVRTSQGWALADVIEGPAPARTHLAIVMTSGWRKRMLAGVNW